MAKRKDRKQSDDPKLWDIIWLKGNIVGITNAKETIRKGKLK